MTEHLLDTMDDLYLELQIKHPAYQEFTKTQEAMKGLLHLPPLKEEMTKLYTSYGGNAAFIEKEFDITKPEWRNLYSFLLPDTHKDYDIIEALKEFEDPQLKSSLPHLKAQPFASYANANHDLLNRLDLATTQLKTAERTLDAEFPTQYFEETPEHVAALQKHATDPADLEKITQYAESKGWHATAAASHAAEEVAEEVIDHEAAGAAHTIDAEAEKVAAEVEHVAVPEAQYVFDAAHIHDVPLKTTWEQARAAYEQNPTHENFAAHEQAEKAFLENTRENARLNYLGNTGSTEAFTHYEAYRDASTLGNKAEVYKLLGVEPITPPAGIQSPAMHIEQPPVHTPTPAPAATTAAPHTTAPAATTHSIQAPTAPAINPPVSSSSSASSTTHTPPAAAPREANWFKRQWRKIKPASAGNNATTPSHGSSHSTLELDGEPNFMDAHGETAVIGAVALAAGGWALHEMNKRHEQQPVPYRQ